MELRRRKTRRLLRSYLISSFRSFRVNRADLRSCLCFYYSTPAAAASGGRENGGRENLLSIRTYDVMITFVRFSSASFPLPLTQLNSPRFFSFLSTATTNTTKLPESGSSDTTRSVPSPPSSLSFSSRQGSLSLVLPFPSLFVSPSQNKTPLTPIQTFQDIPADHAHKTVTMETFPHSGTPLASVHPCKHARFVRALRPTFPPRTLCSLPFAQAPTDQHSSLCCSPIVPPAS